MRTEVLTDVCGLLRPRAISLLRPWASRFLRPRTISILRPRASRFLRLRSRAHSEVLRVETVLTVMSQCTPRLYQMHYYLICVIRDVPHTLQAAARSTQCVQLQLACSKHALREACNARCAMCHIYCYCYLLLPGPRHSLFRPRATLLLTCVVWHVIFRFKIYISSVHCEIASFFPDHCLQVRTMAPKRTLDCMEIESELESERYQKTTLVTFQCDCCQKKITGSHSWNTIEYRPCTAPSSELWTSAYACTACHQILLDGHNPSPWISFKLSNGWVVFPRKGSSESV
jgi:hypothetical protein